MRSYRFVLAVIIFLVAGALVAGYKTKASFNSNVELGDYLEHSDMILSLDESQEYSSIYFDNTIQSVEDLSAKSELIIKAKPSNDRKNFTQAVRSMIEVLEVYKGNKQIEGTNLYLFEPSHFYGKNYFSLGGYQLMQKDKEYILFLKSLKKPTNYSYSEDEAKSYMPVSSYYGKFPIQHNNDSASYLLTRDELDNGIPYSKIQSWDVLTSKEEVLLRFIEIKQAVILSYKN
ncbi:hypothetical protein [Paenibacillus herberti]|uniref:Uncharacterized protein n=1 Tax=Paenibacillus herberti TaxID=1619309 RepID=A0A229P3C5_9BACL|nr:hypothetical protein [Paenibacillus herberti]OXM16587.1 hypothetical protein CGZ75_07975 [Paenibacillus herberti]